MPTPQDEERLAALADSLEAVADASAAMFAHMESTPARATTGRHVRAILEPARLGLRQIEKVRADWPDDNVWYDEIVSHLAPLEASLAGVLEGDGPITAELQGHAAWIGSYVAALRQKRESLLDKMERTN
jgi:hypothetical protein